MVREIGFDNDDRIEVSKFPLFMFLAGALLLMVLCWFGSVGAYNIAINHAPIKNSKEIIWFLSPIIFLLSFYVVVLTTDCLLTKPYIVILSPAGIDLTWPKPQTIAWNDINEIRIDVTTSNRVKFEHLVIVKHSDKEGWFQRQFTPNLVKIYAPLFKGGVDAAYEKVVAAQQRYGIKQ